MNRIRVLRSGTAGVALLFAVALAHATPQAAAQAPASTPSTVDVVHGSDDFSRPRQQEQWASEPGQAQPLSSSISHGFEQAKSGVKVRPMQPQAGQWYARPPDLQAGPTFNGNGIR